ncbi:MAG: GatB/YqeY domain-containing protein [Verrucomicrobia bacterium]|nr:GatB/YqeY domain-containing protein [Verrucomicrobiota bacterium]
MLFDKLQADLKQSMLARDAARTGTVRLLISAARYHAIEKKLAELKDADVTEVLRRQAKQRRDSIESFDKGNRADLADKERAELAIIEGYLPKQLSADELTALVKAAIAETGATSKAQTGQVMKAVMAKAAGRADGKEVSRIVSSLLS